MEPLLAILHHLAAFAIVAFLVAEFVLLRGALDRATFRRFGVIDALYGSSAGIVIGAGVARLFVGPTPVDVYLSNAFFWTKMAAFAAIALVSVYPTIVAVRWRLAARRDPELMPAERQVRRLRRVVALELGIVPVIPISAALMARGIGAL
jgi:putative membrane protein